MKSDTGKNRNKQKGIGKKQTLPLCGTLSYMAECRGVIRKEVPSRWAAPPDEVNRIVRK